MSKNAAGRYPVVCVLLLVLLILPLFLVSCGKQSDVQANKADLTLTGYMVDEHCFVKKPEPELDSKTCLQMEACAASGYGVAVQQDDGSFVFYFFDGSYAPQASGGQKLARRLIDQTAKTDHIFIQVRGTAGEDRLSAGGVSYASIKVSGISETEMPAA